MHVAARDKLAGGGEGATHKATRDALAGGGGALRMQQHGVRWRVAEGCYACSGTGCASKWQGVLRMTRHEVCWQVADGL